ncbi:hypothetical protein QQF64_034256 [Cirrhinus molitorella]|uniref:Uncharacterized protein n=1 Tax=Cirrhinus molitorella TaxID=172907 RepID=A0ABR3MW77_9TELE
MWIQVPKGAILHLGDLALYHLPSEQYQSEVEIPALFRDYNLTLNPELELSIEERGSQMINITPIDTALQALSRLPVLPSFSVGRAWTAADTALCFATAIGYTLTLGLALRLFNRVNRVQRSMSRRSAGRSWTFKQKQQEKVAFPVMVSTKPPTHPQRGSHNSQQKNSTNYTTRLTDTCTCSSNL